MRPSILLLCLSLIFWGCDSDDTNGDLIPDVGGEAGSGGGGAGTGGGEADPSGDEAGSGGEEVPVEAEEIRSEKSRVLEPEIPAGDLANLIEGEAAFSLELYQALAAQPDKADQNLFFSPFSVSQALAMVWAGARGETEAEMGTTLHFDLPQAQLHAAYNGLDQLLHGRAREIRAEEYEEGQGFELSVVNSIWGQRGEGFLDAFLDILAESYGAGLRVLDFIADPEAARQVINAWVEAQTHDRIQDLIPEGAITQMTVMVLVNAIYFKASWAHPFAEGETVEGDFQTAAGETVQAQMMALTEYLGYHASEGFEAFALPYIGRTLSMLVILPEAGQFEAIEAGLTAAQIADIRAGLESQNIQLRFPKFSFTDGVELSEILKALGMPSAFTPGEADLTGFSGREDLYISKVIHKAFVAVDEEGTEAAAATAVVVDGRGMPEEPLAVSADRPFMFFIVDESGAILFGGRVMDPTR